MLHVNLSYTFTRSAGLRTQLDNPLFDILAAIHACGSVAQAAAQLKLSYRHVWGELKKWEATLESELILWERGKRARLSPFGEKLLFAERRAKMRVLPQMDNLIAEMEREFALAFDPHAHVIPMCASHDMALPRLKEFMARDARLYLDLQFRGSLECIEALSRGQCLLAGFHVSEDRAPGSLTQKAFKAMLKPGRHKLINFVGRQQGLMLAPGNPRRIESVQDLKRADVRFVNRQVNSGTRLEIEQLLAEASIAPSSVNGFETAEPTHLAVAAAVASGLADVGFGIRAAAAEFGLEFIPIMREQYYFVCLKEAVDQPPISKLRELLRRSEWQGLIRDLPGYDIAGAGNVIPLRQAFPWYSFRTPK
ncbi:substrate-binding domain-containing protein [Massilia niastensis]|uniref:helix-turn-helix transcriptional regulator n=1 Tax=Massilia niastensis TaxID=544911 RepID=UPI00036C9033|nr:substrate-binding domain-containing protein [Massilia niastensis]